jgi:N-acetylmuramoyl-L-alanine amidase
MRPITVAVDIGHTRSRPGATSARGIPEFNFNQTLAFDVVRSLQHAGFGTRVINADGADIALIERTAQAAGTDFFLSIHHDSVQPQFLKEWSVSGTRRLHSEGLRGYSLLVSSRSNFSQSSLRCASAIGSEMRRAGFRPSRYHAADISGERRVFADEINGVYFYDDLAVLKTARSPALLLEAGVITDSAEEQELATAKTREAIADAVSAGLNKCLREVP